MKNLVGEIISYIKTLEFDTDVDVRPTYSKKRPIYPMISVEEFDNSTRTALKGEERYSNTGYQINIFGKDMLTTSGSNVCRSIAESLDASLQSQYGITRQSVVGMPDANDESVSRLTIRYTGILDVKTDYMYR